METGPAENPNAQVAGNCEYPPRIMMACVHGAKLTVSHLGVVAKVLPDGRASPHRPRRGALAVSPGASGCALGTICDVGTVLSDDTD